MISGIGVAMSHPPVFDGVGQSLQSGIEGDHDKRMGGTVAEPGYVLVFVALKHDQVTGAVHVYRSFPMSR